MSKAERFINWAVTILTAVGMALAHILANSPSGN